VTQLPMPLPQLTRRTSQETTLHTRRLRKISMKHLTLGNDHTDKVLSFSWRKKGSSSRTLSSESESESLCVLFLLPELSTMVQKPSLTKQLSPLRFLRRSPSSSLLLELEVEYAELESTSLAPTIARALPRLSFFLDRHSSLYLFLCLLLWSRLDRYLPSFLGLCL
jgi:hypothetical protein